jgi:hypothetical protein
MPMPATKPAHRPYVVPSSEITTGKQGAREIRKPQTTEQFPNSSCIKKATLWTSDDNGLGIVTIHFKKETNGFSIYEYEASSEQSKSNLKLLVEAREQGQSVGITYREVFRKGAYPPATGIA